MALEDSGDTGRPRPGPGSTWAERLREAVLSSKAPLVTPEEAERALLAGEGYVQDSPPGAQRISRCRCKQHYASICYGVRNWRSE